MRDTKASGDIGWGRLTLLGAALALGLAMRLSYGWHAPLWLDETFSAVIASQPDFAHLLGWCLTELSGPAFYMPLWLWAKLAGNGDLALRVPGLAWSLGAPALIWLRGHPDRDTRLLWTIVVLLWLPAALVAAEARPYPQLFLLALAQAMAFRHLIDAPGRRAALLWSTLTTLAVLTHYSALVIGGVQGVLYLARHRRVALATAWPAVLPFLVAVTWLAVQLHFLLAYTGKHDAAYATLPLSTILDLPAILFGTPLAGLFTLGVMAVTLLFGHARLRQIDADGLLVLSGLIALAVIFGLGFVRPNFAPRYLTSVMPALLFAVACWARWQVARDWKPVVAVIATMMICAGALFWSTLTEPDSDPRHASNIETASAWLGAAHPTKLILFWDGAIAAATRSDRIAEVAGFFLRRAGEPVSVGVVRAGEADDPNRNVLAAAHAAPGAAILWITDAHPAAARTPRITAGDARYICRDFGAGAIIVMACRSR